MTKKTLVTIPLVGLAGLVAGGLIMLGAPGNADDTPIKRNDDLPSLTLVEDDDLDPTDPPRPGLDPAPGAPAADLSRDVQSRVSRVSRPDPVSRDVQSRVSRISRPDPVSRDAQSRISRDVQSRDVQSRVSRDVSAVSRDNTN